MGPRIRFPAPPLRSPRFSGAFFRPVANWQRLATRVLSAGSWDDARTCIVAPQKYLDASTDAAKYDARISYEEVASWFGTSVASDARAVYRRDFLLAGIEQARRGYKAVRDEATTLFCHSYWEDATRLFPELRFEEPGDRPSQSTWIEFRPGGIAPRRIFHKMRAGVVDLAIDAPSARAAELASVWKPLLVGGAAVEETGKTIAVRIAVPTLETLGDYADQLDAARQGMKAAFRLLHPLAADRPSILSDNRPTPRARGSTCSTAFRADPQRRLRSETQYLGGRDQTAKDHTAEES